MKTSSAVCYRQPAGPGMCVCVCVCVCVYVSLASQMSCLLFVNRYLWWETCVQVVLLLWLIMLIGPLVGYGFMVNLLRPSSVCGKSRPKYGQNRGFYFWADVYLKSSRSLTHSLTHSGNQPLTDWLTYQNCIFFSLVGTFRSCLVISFGEVIRLSYDTRQKYYLHCEEFLLGGEFNTCPWPTKLIER